ncbi:hypothetical protein AVEN_97178-1 [Araneus ventricosus]|uniref:Uncharacterized protein n=1 Tax=Araneus ventricosus TaxID=182803 RepID=A0A4Y2DGH8_ARAVE|nr:hypothetical protein AVEN_97178-1 [Araneus ventricosus]
MTLTRERCENLEKPRREMLLLSEERRKKIETCEDILKRKIMDVKNKGKRRKMSKHFTNSSELSPGVNSAPQSSQTGLNRAYLVENLKDLSSVEPTENTKDSSNGEGLNYALLYSSAYDKKIFLKQSVVLSRIAQLMPAGAIQNSIKFSQNKEIKRICKRKTKYTPNLRKIKLSAIPKKNSANALFKYTGPVENMPGRFSGKGLNCSLLYSSVYDKKIFMKQTVVLSDIAKLMLPGTIQNHINSCRNKEIKPICNKKPNCITAKVSKLKLSPVSKKNFLKAPTKRQMSSIGKISVSPNIIKRDKVKNIRLSKNYLTAGKQGRIGKVLKDNDIQCVNSLFHQDRKGFLNSNSVKVEEINDSLKAKLASYEATKGNDTIAMFPELRIDTKISVEPYVVLENLSNSKKEVNVYPEIKISNAENKKNDVIISSNTKNRDSKLSVLRPLVVLKDIIDMKSNQSRSMDDKRVKVSVLDNGKQNDPKLFILKPGIVLKDIISSKSYVQTAAKKVKTEISPSHAKKVKVRISPSHAVNNDLKSSLLNPVLVLKDTKNIKLHHSRLTDDKSKRAKVSVLDNGIQNDPKLSILKPRIVLKDLIRRKTCIQTGANKVKSGNSSSSAIKSEPRSSVLSPVAGLKCINSIKSNHSGLTDDKSKRAKVSVLDNDNQNDPKFSILKPGIKSKLFIHTGANKEKSELLSPNSIKSSVLSPVPGWKDISNIKSNQSRLADDESKKLKVNVYKLIENGIQIDSKLSKLKYSVSKDIIRSKSCIETQAEKVKSVTMSRNMYDKSKRTKGSVLANGIQDFPKVSMLKPVVLSKDIINSKSCFLTAATKIKSLKLPRNKDDISKRVKVNVLENDIHNDPKSSIFKSVAVSNDIICSKSCSRTVSKKVKAMTTNPEDKSKRIKMSFPENGISDFPKVSLLKPVVLSKDKINSKSCFLTESKAIKSRNLSSNKDDKSKSVKTFVLVNAIQNDSKFSPFKPGNVLKDIIRSHAIKSDPKSSVLRSPVAGKDITSNLIIRD